MDIKEKALALLRTGVGNSEAEFRPDQWEAINLIINGKRLLLVEATGWGKSYVYFIATSLLRESGKGMAILVSPLLSLMRNQLLAAEKMGINAATINSSNQDEWLEIYDNIKSNQIDILLVSPERLANKGFVKFLNEFLLKRLSLLIIDEAHCISDWGHDFRPDYQHLKRIINLLPVNIPVLATTATANDRVVKDIRDQLQKKFIVIRGELMRKSIALQNIIIPDPYTRMVWLANMLKILPGSGIVYVLTINYCETIAGWLVSQGINAQAYHSRIKENSQFSRDELENAFLNNKIKVLVATVALGMGYDKPDISFVIHFHRPASVVHYYQQVGRAGRALQQAWGFLLQGDEDIEINNYFIEQAYPLYEHVNCVLEAIAQAPEGLNKNSLKIKANMRDAHLDQVLKLLAVTSPSPITYEYGRYYRNGNKYIYPAEKVKKLMELRQQEQLQMISYVNHQDCLMRFLAEKLDDPYQSDDCGRCSNCQKRDLFEIEIKQDDIIKAEQFVRLKPLWIAPRKIFPQSSEIKFYNKIPFYLEKSDLMLEFGQVLCRYRDPGLGKMVAEGKYKYGKFDQRLVEESVKLIYERWFKSTNLPFNWITCIPSAKHPELVPDFAQRLAKALNLDFLPVIISTNRKKHDQKTMNNNTLKLINLDGEYEIDKNMLRTDSVLIVDDMVESGWTLNLAGILLKFAGLKGKVYPFALANTREL
ncbi:MAG: RecQ family ATP-dependent DNA helicase [Candidatus Stygibacter frigidus]|nr:RecQ family ATP-dependent DNA helicase [Candidatus Stygibacter frigidus]